MRFGSYMMYADVARFYHNNPAPRVEHKKETTDTKFQQKPTSGRSFAEVIKGNVPGTNEKHQQELHQSMELAQSDLIKEEDHKYSLMIKMEWFGLVSWSGKSFKKVASLWGECLFIDKDKEEPLAQGRVCILTKCFDKVSGKVNERIKDQMYVASVHEMSAWSPTFRRPMENHDVASEKSEAEMNVDMELEEINEVANEEKLMDKEQPINRDPFNLDSIIKNQGKKDATINQNMEEIQKSSPSIPPGYNWHNEVEKEIQLQNIVNNGEQEEPKVLDEESIAVYKPCKGSSRSSSSAGVKNKGGSFINDFNNHIEMGKLLGVDMKGSKKDLSKLIERMSENGGFQ
ncbi:hypothetical protein L1987_38033 [Smallanthus sonchifolius]|uniref:Uncharacterized protein n=1 Tax=Smallanthus sonchifolius TaxID=185202 RepID=A0ACB9HIR1_9ASTR|nr:hypothetical protein L1987_38033 [Smallanthus sonchifolius]